MKRFRIVAFILLLLVVVTSCMSTSEIDQMTPLNLYSKRKFRSEHEVFFIGEGRAETQRQAELLSYVDLNDKVYRYLGIDSEPESYRELTTAGTITAYNLKIQEKTSYVSNGEYIVALAASADETLLAKDRSPNMQKEEMIAQQAIDLVLQGDNYIKANEDIEGIRCYLKSMELSYGLQYIEDEFSFSAILEEVLDLLSVIKVEILSYNSNEATCSLKITRNDGIIPSKVKNSEIKSVFKSEDSRGLIFDDNFVYTSNNKGLVDFVPRAYNIAKNGAVSFVFDFDEEIKNIEKLSPFTANTIKSAVEQKVVSFDYNLQASDTVFGICSQCVDIQGSPEGDNWLDDLLISKYEELGVKPFSFEFIEDETEQELLERFKKTNPTINNLIIIRAGVGEVFETRMDVCSVAVEGSVVIYDVINNKVVYDSATSYSNGFGATVLEAQENAFTNFVLKMFTLLKAYYV